MPNGEPLHETLRKARAALASGKFTQAQVDAAIRDKHPKIGGLKSLAEAVEGTQREQKETRLAKLGGNALTDFLLQAIPFSDELAALAQNPLTAARAIGAGPLGAGATLGADPDVRETQGRLSERRDLLFDLAPDASLLSAAAPIGVPGLGHAAKAPTFGRALVRGAGAGAAVGGLLGLDFGEDPTGRALSAGGGALAGGALGLLAPVVGAGVSRVVPRLKETGLGQAVGRLRQSRGERIAGALKEFTGAQKGLQGLRDAVDADLQRVSRELYEPLKEAFPAITDDAVLAQLRDPRIAKIVRRTLPKEALAFVQGEGGRAPSFAEVQRVRQIMSKMLKPKPRGPRDVLVRETIGGALDELDNALSAVDPRFAEATTQWRMARRIGEAVEEGYKAFGAKGVGRSDVLAARVSRMTQGEATGFTEGYISRIVEQLELAGDSGSGIVKKLVNARQSPEMSERLRFAFPDDQRFQEMLGVLVQEKRRLTREAIMERLRPWIALAALGYLGFRAAQIAEPAFDR